MEIFDEFIIVYEQVISQLTVPQNGDDYKLSFRERIQFAKLEFTISDYLVLKIKDIGNASSSNPSNLEPLAQIVRWHWDQNGEQQIISTHILNKGSEVNYDSIANDSSIVIRILKKRETKSEIAFPAPFNSSPDDVLTVKIGEKQMMKQQQKQH